MTPVGRHVALAAPSVALAPMLVVCTLRRVVGLAATYGVGRLYGDAAVAWTEQRYPRFGAWIRFVERLFVRWGVALVVVAPSHSIAVLAGAGGTRAGIFFVLAAIGELGWVLCTYYFGELISDWTEPAIGFLSRHLLASTLVVLGLVAAQQIFSRRRGPGDGT
jgi:membrane protein DedA with SNARE-associated domain